MSNNRDLSAAAAQLGFHSSNIGIGSEAPRYALDVYNSNLLVSGPSAGNLILEDRGVGDSSRPFHVVSSDGGKFTINRSNRNASGTTTSSVNSLTLSSSGNLGLGVQTSPAANIHIGDISAGYELKITGNALQFNRSSSSYIDQLHDTGSILFRMTSSHSEAMRITSGGDMGLGTASPTARLDVRRDDTDGKIAEFHQSTGYGIQIRSSESVATIRAEYNQALIFETGTTATERFRIKSDGKIGFNAANPPRDYCFHSGQADTNIQITNNTTGIDDSAGALIQQDGNDLYIWNKENSFMSLGTNAAERVRILSNGHANFGGYRTSVSNCGLHVGRGSGGTAAGESVLAATLGNDSTMVSALLTVKNAGNRGTQGHVSGSPLAKFEFNNGTAFEIDKNGYRTLPYQPCAMAFNAQGQYMNGGSVAQFNSTRFNIGNMYNSSNGRMTVPVDGRYLVAYSGLHDYISQSAVGFDIRINGSTFNGGEAYQESNNISNSQLSKTLILHLSANDYVDIYIRSSGTRVHQRYGSFSMCLIT